MGMERSDHVRGKADAKATRQVLVHGVRANVDGVFEDAHYVLFGGLSNVGVGTA
jgi:hypothetical protein